MSPILDGRSMRSGSRAGAASSRRFAGTVALAAALGLTGLLGALASPTAASATIPIWTEDFEDNPAARGVEAVQSAAPGTTGSLTGWNLIDTAGTTAVRAWDGAYEGTHFYYVGFQGAAQTSVTQTARTASGLAYTDNADASLILKNRAVPGDSGRTTATLSFALAGASEAGADVLHVDVRDRTIPGFPYATLATFSGHDHLRWNDGTADWTSGPNNGMPRPAAACCPLTSAIQSVDVTEFMGKRIDLRFRFTSDAATNDWLGPNSGWNIDLVQLTESGGATIPSAPRALEVTSASSAVVDLTWTEPTMDGDAPITGYNVYRGTTSGSGALVGASSMTGFSDDTVSAGTQYFFTVTASNSAGESPPSDEVSITAQPTKIWSSHFRPQAFHGDVAFRLDVAIHGPSDCRFEAEASGRLREKPVTGYSQDWLEDRDGNPIIGGGGSGPEYSGIHAGPLSTHQFREETPQEWRSSGSLGFHDVSDGAFHWVYFGVDLEPALGSPGLQLSARCQGDFDVEFYGGTPEMEGMAPSSFPEGAGAQTPVIWDLCDVPRACGEQLTASREQFQKNFTSPKVVLSGYLFGSPASAGTLTLDGPQESKTWTLGANDVLVDFSGGPGPYTLRLDSVSIWGEALVMLGLAPIEEFEDATVAHAD